MTAGVIPKGTVFSLSTAFGTAAVMSAISNANPAVASLAAGHNVAANDIVLVASAWPLADGRVFKAGTISTNDVPLVGLNSLDTASYPAGAGLGSVKEVSSWLSFSGLNEVSSSGGEPQFVTYTLIDDGMERQIQKGKSAKSIKLTLLDNPTAAWNDTLISADEDGAVRVLRAQLKNGTVLYYPVTVAFDTTPSMDISKVMTVSATFSIMAKETRYNPS
jgi:hypothetical protein